MNKIVLGLVVGGVLGVFDGLTAWFYPEARPQILGIVFGSTFKGLLAGLLIGLFARKIQSMPATLLFGLVVAGLFAFLVASLQGAHYLAIIVPGSLVGLLTGYATQRYGRVTPASA